MIAPMRWLHIRSDMVAMDQDGGVGSDGMSSQTSINKVAKKSFECDCDVRLWRALQGTSDIADGNC